MACCMSVTFHAQVASKGKVTEALSKVGVELVAQDPALHPMSH